MKKYGELFEPFSIGKLEIKNRFVMGPMAPFGMADSNGGFNERGINYYVERAKGEVGLIITGASSVNLNTEDFVRPSVPCPTENPAAFLKSASLLTERVHAYGSKIFFQLASGFGRIGMPHIFKNKIAPSECENRWDPSIKHRAMTTEEVEQMVQDFIMSAVFCKKSGFDGVQVHAVHEGYLLDQFALAIFNKRTDKYGGDLTGRLRMATEIVQGIKKACGQDFPVTLRYSLKSYMKGIRQGAVPGEDFEEIGRDYEEGLEAARILTEAGYDALDVDAGTYDSWYWNHPPMYFEDGMYLPFSKQIKDHVDTCIITAGRLDNPEIATKAILDKSTDFISLARPLLADPFIVRKIRQNKLETIRPCLSCHEACIGRIERGVGISCAVNAACCREEEYGLTPALEKKEVMVVGGGLAGMEFARVAALRGHKVDLYEAKSKLGGNIIPGGAPSFKKRDLMLVDWYKQELEKLQVNILMDTQVRAQQIIDAQPDVLAITTGSKPIVLNIKGSETNRVYNASEVLLDHSKAGDESIIIGAGLVGCELAYSLALAGKKVALVEASNQIMGGPHGLPFPNYDMLKDLLAFHNVPIYMSSMVTEITADGVVMQDAEGKSSSLSGDTVIFSVGYSSENSLYDEVKNSVDESYIIGDAKSVKNIMYAIWDSYEIARSI